QRLAAMSPAALRERGLTEEEIEQVTSITAESPFAGMTEGMEPQPDTATSVPSPLNPFGNLTKRQVLALALSEGASAGDLKEVEAIYDMMAADSQTVSAETIQVADSLRAEYFKRSQENNWVEIVNSYNKVTNTT